MLVLHETDLRAGPIIPKIVYRVILSRLTLLALNFKLILIYSTIKVRKTSLYLFLHVHVPLWLAILWTPVRMFRISMTPQLL